MLQDFKKFILRGNVIDLAVAVVIGSSFTNIINSLTKDFIYPLISSLYNPTKLSSGYFIFKHQKFLYGNFINAIISFLIVAAIIFFVVIQPINKITAYNNRHKKPADPDTKKCEQCLSVIPIAAKRCAFCTTTVK